MRIQWPGNEFPHLKFPAYSFLIPQSTIKFYKIFITRSKAENVSWFRCVDEIRSQRTSLWCLVGFEQCIIKFIANFLYFQYPFQYKSDVTFRNNVGLFAKQNTNIETEVDTFPDNRRFQGLYFNDKTIDTSMGSSN